MRRDPVIIIKEGKPYDDPFIAGVLADLCRAMDLVRGRAVAEGGEVVWVNGLLQ